MSVKRFKFVSPGVFINEIDNSQLPADPAGVGPTIIGRFPRGPSNRPVTVNSFSEFVEIFGSPVAGGKGGDVWREGNTIAPTYAAYAAQAFLRNSSPINVVRVLGEPHPDAVTGGEAGWKIANDHADGHLAPGPSENGGAFGLFLFSSGSAQRDEAGSFLGAPLNHPLVSDNSGRSAKHPTGSLAAVWYFDNGAIELSGAFLPGVSVADIGAGGDDDATNDAAGVHAGNAIAFRPTGTNYEFTSVLFDSANRGKKVVFNFDRTSDKYIRKVFNTNPTLLGDTDTINAANQKGYFLGETFDRFAKDINGSTVNEGSNTHDSSLFGVILGLKSTNSTYNFGVNQVGTQNSQTTWFFSQDLTTNTSKFDAGKMQKLFRLVALNDGAWSSRNLKVSISDHKAPTEVDPYGSFTVTLRHVRDSDAAPRVIEKYSNCNLNPNSTNYIGAKIGDQYQEWDNAEQRYRVYGNYPNQSRFVRVVIDSDVDQGITDPACLPFGFYGPARYKRKVLTHHDPFKAALTGSTLHGSGSGLLGVEGALVSGGGSQMHLTGASVTTFSGRDADANSPILGAGIFNSFLTASTDGSIFV